MINKCGFCERIRELTFHHYIPKTLHSNKLFRKKYPVDYMKNHGVDLCDDCHRAIHDFFTEKELGKDFNCKEKLFTDERVRKFIRWVKKQH